MFQKKILTAAQLALGAALFHVWKIATKSLQQNKIRVILLNFTNLCNFSCLCRTQP